MWRLRASAPRQMRRLALQRPLFRITNHESRPFRNFSSFFTARSRFSADR